MSFESSLQLRAKPQIWVCPLSAPNRSLAPRAPATWVSQTLEHWGALMRLGLIASLLCLCTVSLCLADPAKAAIRKDLNVPPEDLSPALQTVATTYELQVLYPTQVAKDLKTHGAVGSFTPDDALKAVLSGTGLSYKYLDANTVTVFATVAPTGVAASAGQDQTNTAQDNSKEAGKRSSQDFQLAQANQNVPAGSASVNKDDQNAQTESSRKAQLEEVLVTGTHIHGVEPSSPVMTITQQDIERSGYTTVGDVMLILPENFGGGNNPQVLVASAPGLDNISTSGGSAPNLRGIGSGSTLTLIDGHRLAADTVNGAADVSLIPLAAVERIDVVTDGASAVYGSDAVAGVVNIILKKQYDGALTTLVGGGTAGGGATQRQFNQLLGRTWGSGSAMMNYEYDYLTPIDSSQRDYTLDALSPTTLLPGYSRNSFFVNARQDLSSSVTAFVEGLYAVRHTSQTTTYAGPFVSTSGFDVHQYSAAGGFDVALPRDWKISAVGDVSDQKTTSPTYTEPSTPQPTITYDGRMSSVEVSADGPALQLQSGTVGVAAGGGYRRESYADVQTGLPNVVDASRNVKYAYAEVQLPLIPTSPKTQSGRLDLNVSGRYEGYSDAGGRADPKVGLVYGPSQSIKLRTTWGKAFRAPTLYSMYESQALLYLKIPDPASSAGTSNALIPLGGNSALRPETATTWTAGADYDSETLKGLHINATYYNIAYIDRISRIPNFFTALTDPLNAPFVTRAPSLAYLESLFELGGSNFNNFTGMPYNPLDVAAVVNDEEINVARQDISGVDLTADYKRDVMRATTDFFVNATFLDLRQRLVPGAPEVEISGEAFEPSKFRARGGTNWTWGPWSATGIVNFVGGEVNTYLPSLPHVSSWTTVDLQLAYESKSQGVLAGMHGSVSVLNIFNRNPPFLVFDQYVPGLHYDPLNASVMGRTVFVRVSKSFW
jgi:iron complex outermembrane receptor protein